MEKTFEELTRERIDKGDAFTPTGIIEMMKQVREATAEEFCQALLGVKLPAETVKKIGKIVTTTDRIKLTDK